MKQSTFNIFAQLDNELNDYFQEKVTIGNGNEKEKRNPYKFSQFDTLETIDYYTASMFENKRRDADGSKRIFLNIVSFRAATAAKNIDLDVKDFNFIPEGYDGIFASLLYRRRFRRWAKKEKFGKMINGMVDRYPKYGTIVAKRIGKEVEDIPLQRLRNQQDATSLQTASYVIEEHDNMPVHEMEAMPDWDLDGLDFAWDGTSKVYERYGRVPLSFYKEMKGEKPLDGDDGRSVDTMSILIKDVKASKDKPKGAILFIEEIQERPYLEAHYEKVDGRWLGLGEVEKNFGNQVAKNTVFNLRKKSVAWSSKNIFQTMDDTLAKNLVREVKDGDVLQMSMQGGITRVDTTNRANADYNSIDQVVEDNANQRSFTFEVATGESLPSGTAFRLGAMLSNSVNSYYGKKREQLGIFLTEIVTDFLVPAFKKDDKKSDIEAIADGEEGFDILRQAKKDYLINRKLVKAVLSGKPVDMEAIKELVDREMANKDIDFYSFPDKFWDSLNTKVSIETTGESMDVQKRMETLVTLYTSMIQSGDPQASKVLGMIMAITGNKMPTSSAPAAAPLSTPPAPSSLEQAEQIASGNEQQQF